MASQNLQEYWHTLLAQGVTKFPVPCAQVIENSTSTPTISASTSENINSPSTCTLCSLSENRIATVISPEQKQCKYFALAEFPENNVQINTNIFAEEKNVAKIIFKLLDKLSIINNTHCSYAIKCVSKKSISNTTLKMCSTHLASEIIKVNPDIILCFGTRALDCLKIAFAFNTEPGLQVANIGEFIIANKQRTVIILPSPLELDAFPHWRSEVWSLLQSVLAI